jgi:16S rRNA C1402 (ribose-2'-O) methylase RsmI
MTKVHEELVKGPINVVLKSLRTKVKGEITVVIQPKLLSYKKKSPPTTEQVWKEFCHLTEELGLGKRESISRIAKSYDMKSRDIYSAIVRSKT